MGTKIRGLWFRTVNVPNHRLGKFLDIFVESGNVHYLAKTPLFWHEYPDWMEGVYLRVE